MKYKVLAAVLASATCCMAASVANASHYKDKKDKKAPEAKELKVTLTGWAALPDSARTPGPTSGQFIEHSNGITPPFVGTQPIPGWSGLLNNGDGTYTAMPDNGYGSKNSSPDYVIGFYNVTPYFKTEGDGTSVPGAVVNNYFIPFSDPNGFLNNGEGVELSITADFANYQTVARRQFEDSGIAVDPSIIAGRLLTGFDFDVESIARDDEGNYWVGEEFGPYLLKFNAQGEMIQEPVPHPFLASPFNPNVQFGGEQATLGSSRGFESLAFNEEGTLLYAVPEAAPSVDDLRPVPGDERYLNIFEFDPAANAYTGNDLVYKKDGPETGNSIVIGDMTNVGGTRYVLIERDSAFGFNAVVKRLYLIDLTKFDDAGVLQKRLLVDLLDIADPRDIGGDLLHIEDPLRFNFPFDSIENVVVVDKHTLGVAIDTNYPFEDARVCTICTWESGDGPADDTEFVTLRFNQKLSQLTVDGKAMPKDKKEKRKQIMQRIKQKWVKIHELKQDIKELGRKLVETYR